MRNVFLAESDDGLVLSGGETDGEHFSEWEGEWASLQSHVGEADGGLGRRSNLSRQHTWQAPLRSVNRRSHYSSGLELQPMGEPAVDISDIDN
jgi:hypothetical protein